MTSVVYLARLAYSVRCEQAVFVDKDEFNEIWEGFRYGPQGAKSESLVDEAYSIGELSTKLPELLKPVKEVYHHWGLDREFDQELVSILGDIAQANRSGSGPMPVKDLASILAPHRQRKSHWEIEQLREACRATADGFAAVVAELPDAVRRGRGERWIDCVAIHGFATGALYLRESSCYLEGEISVVRIRSRRLGASSRGRRPTSDGSMSATEQS